MKTRIEKDALGSLAVPANAYYGIFTVRASKHFHLTGTKTHPELIKAYALIKLACAKANVALGQLDRKRGQAIIRAAEEVLAGKFNDQFKIDMLQAGAGTPMHMNANEVIANRAIELLGGKKGDYSLVNPNNQVNFGQSSNDVTPTAIRLAARARTEPLLEELALLAGAFAAKAKEFDRIVKVGRTHLQDAVPIRLGQEFSAYREAVARGRERIAHAILELHELQLGGTAVGTGITAHPRMAPLAIREIARRTGFPCYPAKNRFYLMQSMAAFAVVASALEIFALDMLKVADDLMLLSSGPRAGLGEILLPSIEPGSSIMPGKINPSVVEAFKMVCLQVIGNSRAIHAAVPEGDLEINVMTPLIAYNLIGALEVLTNGCRLFRRHCVAGIKADRIRTKELFDRAIATATALSPYISYQTTADLVHAALAKNRPLEDLVVERGVLPRDVVRKLLRPEAQTEPGGIDKALLRRIRAAKKPS